MTRNRVVIATLLLVALIAGLWWAQRRSAESTASTGASSSVVTVRRGALAAEVSATGIVTAARRAQLAFPSSGRIAEVNVVVGDGVAAGAALMSIETTQLQFQSDAAAAQADAAQAAVEQARTPATTAEIQAAQASVEAAQLALSIAEADRDALPEEQRGTSAEAARAEQARATLLGAEARLRTAVDGASAEEIATLDARARAAAAQAALAREALAQATLHAPYAATIIEIGAQVGEIVGSGQKIVTLADLTTLEVEADVDEVDVGQVVAGQSATITLDAFPTQPMEGEVVRLAPAASGARGATSYTATIRFDPQSLPVRLDMAADVLIQTAEATDALLLPLDTIRYAESQPFVRVWREGQWQDQTVTLGPQDGSEVVILTGVVDGERVQR